MGCGCTSKGYEILKKFGRESPEYQAYLRDKKNKSKKRR